MIDIGFYHLTKSPLERALPQLLEKVQGIGERALVLTPTAERAEGLAHTLWVYEEASFLPHGTEKDGRPQEQPIWIAEGPVPADGPPNGARYLLLVDGVEPASLDSFDRAFILFDGTSDQAVTEARRQWSALKSAGHSLAYWRQTERGGWEKAA